MPLVRLSEFRLMEYEGKPPDIRTLKRDVNDGILIGGFRDARGRYWVDMDIYRKSRKLGNKLDEILIDAEVAALIE